ncbi:protein ACCELERATED CELL DEATH 6-like [Cryptomeria japonica]|uniref:protein ACCELERATED CELL DEATH 6-like n=1 Tax=Cryptomeria japonica TaxID=3369 RepID=UPI0027D9EC7B|nr:protein ACCELERATED CELL DEATH 6-like [Cryptomeria japonica]
MQAEKRKNMMKRDLFVASEAGDVCTIQSLHEQNGHALREVTFQKDTPLHIAARKGHIDLVKWILQINPSLGEARNKDKNTPLHEAVKSGNLDVVEKFLELKQRVVRKQSTFYRATQTEYNKFAETPLVIASQYGYRRIVERLLEARSFEDQFEWDRSFREAAYRGYEDVLVAIFDNPPRHNRTSFLSKFSGSQVSLEVDVPRVIPKTPILHAVVQGGRLESVVAMLNHESWRNDTMTEEDEYGRCAVHVAAMKGRMEMIDEFMMRIPDSIEIRSSDQRSVLHFAVEYDQFDVVRCLLANKEEKKAEEMVSRDHDLSRNTTLHFAAINGVSLQILDLLLPFRGANINVLNDEGMNGLDIASAAPQDNPNCAKIVERLEAAGAVRSTIIPKSNTTTSPSKDDSIISTHMVVASLIATITFAVMFQIPGGIEDDKESIHYGAAKLAFHKVFRLFLFSDTTAFIASIVVVVAWLLRQQLKVDFWGGSAMDTLSDFSEASLLVSICWTVVAFVSATITVLIPHDLDSLKSRDREVFSKYESLLTYEIVLVLITPIVVAVAFLFKFEKRKIKKYLLINSDVFAFVYIQMVYLVIIILIFAFK